MFKNIVTLICYIQFNSPTGDVDTYYYISVLKIE